MKSVSRAVLAAVAGGALIATAISAPAAEAKSQEPGQVSIPQRYLDQTVKWSNCSFNARVKELAPDAPDTRCAIVKVPMDWQNPDDHPDINLAISHSEATGESRGIMLTNPGGPGGAGLSLSASLAISKPQLFTDYDLVGFDPRGFGKSEALNCSIDSAKLEALPVTPDYRERTALTHQVEVAEAKLLAEACSNTEFSEFVSTQQTVYDMDFIRELMAAEKMNFIGYSYGTWMGSWYADTYPERVDRFVLDSNMNWTGTMHDNATTDSFSFQRRRDEQLFPWIARNSETYDLGETAEEVEASYEKIRAELVRLTKQGVDVPTGGDLDYAVLSPIYSNERFVTAAEVIVQLEQIAFSDHPEVEGAKVATDLRAEIADMAPQTKLAAAREALAPGDETVALGAIGTVVRCNDTPYSKSAARYLSAADRDARRYSYIGYSNTVPMCAYWPFKQEPRDIDLTDSPKVLMIQAEADPATATEGALESHYDTKKKSVFVGIQDEGQHGIYIGGPSPCVEEIGDAFVFDGKLPANMTMCSTTPILNDDQVYPVEGPLDRFAAKESKRAKRSAGAPPAKASKMLKELRRQAVGQY